MTTAAQDLLVPTSRGLFCAEGGFYVDPWAPVERAVITHAHSDHVAAGCGTYLCSERGQLVLRERLALETSGGPGGLISAIPYGSGVDFGSVRITLYPAGHILGSSQVLIERRGERWVVSGDYKTEVGDRTCEPFVPVECGTFITESTFGLPIYRWPQESSVFADINAWWRENAAKGRTSIIFAYALGKAQRVLSGLDVRIGPLAVHGAVERFNRAYRDAGIALPEAPHATEEVIRDVRGKGLVVAPPSALGSPWVRRFAGGEGFSAAFVSGWMLVRGTRRRKAVDRGFVISDHADWSGLHEAIQATRAGRVGVTHGYVTPMVRWLRESGIDAFPVPTRFTGETGEETEAGAPEGEPGGAMQ